MSVARVHTVQKSMKPGRCEKCGKDLPKGSAYRHFKVGFRSRYKHVRCMDPACTPRTSELESSMLAEVYAAQEGAHEAIDAAESIEDIKESVQAVADAAREVASRYDEASTDENGTEWNTDAAERRDILESAADELDNWEPDIDDDELKVECENCGGTGRVDCDNADFHNEDREVEEGETCPDCDGEPGSPGVVDCSECEDGEREPTDEEREEKLQEVRDSALAAIDEMEMP